MRHQLGNGMGQNKEEEGGSELRSWTRMLWGLTVLWV